MIVHSAVDQKNNFGAGKKETNMGLAFLRWVNTGRVTAIQEILRLNNLCCVTICRRTSKSYLPGERRA